MGFIGSQGTARGLLNATPLGPVNRALGKTDVNLMLLDQLDLPFPSRQPRGRR